MPIKQIIKSICFIVLLFFYSLSTFSQKSSSKTLSYDHGLSLEVLNQRCFGIGLGGLIGKNIGHKTSPNYCLGLYADVLFADRPIISQRIKFTWNYLSILGVGLNLSNNYRESSNDLRLMPELNFSLFGIGNIFIGYCIPLGKNAFSDLSNYRIGMNLNFIHSK